MARRLGVHLHPQTEASSMADENLRVVCIEDEPEMTTCRLILIADLLGATAG
jgi:hypothetical protein